MSEQIKVLLRLERKPEIDEVLQVLSEMTLEEQKMMFVFMQGVKFAKGMERKMVIPAIVQS